MTNRFPHGGAGGVAASAPSKPIKPRCIAIIGDMVDSRSLQLERSEAQLTLKNTLKQLNTDYKEFILSKFVITTGDEFQGLLHNAHLIPDLCWVIETKFTYTPIRLGIGCGELNTPLDRSAAIGMDGPVWYKARDAVNIAKTQKKMGGVFAGFGEEDITLNGLARLLYLQRSKLSEIQREALFLLRKNHAHKDIATKLNKTKQSITNYIDRANWSTIQEGERAWLEILNKFDFAVSWKE